MTTESMAIKSEVLATTQQVDKVKPWTVRFKMLYRIILVWRGLHQWMRVKWHEIVCRLFKVHIGAEITGILHPEFGTYWKEDGDGRKIIAAAHKSAYKVGYDQGMKDQQYACRFKPIAHKHKGQV